jgi:hypothetical protein
MLGIILHYPRVTEFPCRKFILECVVLLFVTCDSHEGKHRSKECRLEKELKPVEKLTS